MRLTRRRFLSATTALLPLQLPGAADAAPPAVADSFKTLTAGKATAAMLSAPAPKTALLGFDGQCPGPLLRYKKGEEIKIRFANTLAEAATFSPQGMRLPNAMDGVAALTQAAVAPGHSFDYRFTPPDSGFYWYRSGVTATESSDLDHGLYGPLIVEEAEPPLVDRDLPLIFDDWRLNAAGEIIAASAAAKPDDHFVVTLNGEATPLAMDVLPGARLRLRLLNLAQSQIAFLLFSGLKPTVIAIDGQPCEPFAPLRYTLPVGPGACFDVMCDLPVESGMQASIAWRTGERNDRPLVVFNTRGGRRPALPPIQALPPNPRLPTVIKLQQAKRADLVFDAVDKGAERPTILPNDKHGPVTLNGKTAQIFGDRPLFVVRRGTPVSLSFVNKTALLLQIHVHGHAMRLLHDLDDGWEPYWRCRVIVAEGRTKHTAFVADNPGKWAIECQTLEAQPARLVTWFEVV